MYQKKLKKLMVVNRGEIALRVINTARKMNIETVALVTQAEKNALHGKAADQVIEIGEGPSLDSYLNQDKLINIALQNNIDAIHPGYGFLSETVSFVKKTEQANINFIGPNSETMAKMGAKDVSKQIMIDNKIPVTPGFFSDDQNPELLKNEAIKIGFPVIIKAVMGGGGKGMRIVRHQDEFLDMLKSCQAEAKNAFNDSRVLLEKYIEDPKHIEVQILADQHGNTFHFYERDCSIQRRHQKIIEEAPSCLEPNVAKKIRETAVRAAQTVNYTNAGTIEFLVDKQTLDFYFMEMNTRLQVEHTVSEMITGHDLVELQLKVAQGESLQGLKIPDKPLGHSIEARICAEDPFNNFLPSTGTIKRFKYMNKKIENWDDRKESKIPEDVIEKRLDSSFAENSIVTQYYDSMIGKLIVFGKDREEALRKLQKQLKNTEINGVSTNIPFILNLFKDQDFINFNYSLKYFENKKDLLLQEPSYFDTNQLCGFVIQNLFSENFEEKNEFGFQNLRVNNGIQKLFRVQVKRSHSMNNFSEMIEIYVNQDNINQRKFNIQIDHNDLKENIELEVIEKQQDYVIFQNQKQIVKVDQYITHDKFSYFKNGSYFEIKDCTYESFVQQEDQIQKDIVAPMPGTITKIDCTEGDEVKKGQVLATLTAMKMENKIIAEKKMKIIKILCSEGQYVEQGAILMETDDIEDQLILLYIQKYFKILLINLFKPIKINK